MWLIVLLWPECTWLGRRADRSTSPGDRRSVVGSETPSRTAGAVPQTPARGFRRAETAPPGFRWARRGGAGRTAPGCWRRCWRDRKPPQVTKYENFLGCSLGAESGKPPTNPSLIFWKLGTHLGRDMLLIDLRGESRTFGGTQYILSKASRAKESGQNPQCFRGCL